MSNSMREVHNLKTLTLLLLFIVLILPSCSHRITKHFLLPGEAVVQKIDQPAKKSPCTDFMNYAPDSVHPEYTPIRYVRMRFFVVRHDSNNHNFDLPKAKLFVQKMLDEANYNLSRNDKMNLPPGNKTPVLPINYRYVTYPDPNTPGDDGFTMVYDSALCYLNKKTAKNGYYDDALTKKYHIQKDSVLNVFLLEHNPDSLGSRTYNFSNDGVGFPTWMKLVCRYSDTTTYHKNAEGNYYYEHSSGMGGLLNHEMGHTLGLMHSWSNDDCDDTPNNPNCWDQTSGACVKEGYYSNNVMDYNNRQSAMTPCQIAHVQYYMAKEGTTQRKLLLNNWCQYHPDMTIKIPNGDSAIWKSSRDLEGDVVVSNNATLVIQCRVSMPAGSKIILHPKATLIVDGGEITNICGDKWQGIEVWQSKKGSSKIILLGDSKISRTINNPMP